MGPVSPKEDCCERGAGWAPTSQSPLFFLGPAAKVPLDSLLCFLLSSLGEHREVPRKGQDPSWGWGHLRQRERDYMTHPKSHSRGEAASGIEPGGVSQSLLSPHAQPRGVGHSVPSYVVQPPPPGGLAGLDMKGTLWSQRDGS